MASDKKIHPKAWVALKVDPQRHGQVLQVSRNGRTAKVQFAGFQRPTLHAVEGLILISDSNQLRLFR